MAFGPVILLLIGLLHLSASHQEVIIVSTLDGHLRGLSVRDGSTMWTLENPPLVSQSLSDLEFIKDGKKFRLIPSLDGQLYMLELDGGRKGLHALPITAEALFTSSFQLSSDSMLVGGKDQRVLGFNPLNGEIKYHCTKDGCQQASTFRNNEVSCDLLLCRRVSHIVRAVDIDSGHEKWNFSVGQDEVITTNMASSYPHSPSAGGSVEERAMRYKGCFMYPEDEADEGVTTWTFEVEAGVIQASSKAPFKRIRWRKELGASLSRVWLFRGRSLQPMSLFSRDSHSQLEHASDEYGCPIRRSLFLGAFNGQMYIQLEDGSGRRSPRPVYVALPSNEVSKVEGNDYAIVSRHRVSKVTRYADPHTSHQGFFRPSSLQDHSEIHDRWFTFQGGSECYPYFSEPLLVKSSYFLFQKITFVCLLAVVGHLFFQKVYLPYTMSLRIQEPLVQGSLSMECNNHCAIFPDTTSQPSPGTITSPDTGRRCCNELDHVSRYECDYEHVRCLGRGAFGVVFEARHRVDQYHYAVKRVRVRYSPRARDRLLQEVQAFAHLEHPGIVRYYQAWFELPPDGWQERRDRELNLTKADPDQQDTEYSAESRSKGVYSRGSASTTSLTCEGDSDEVGWDEECSRSRRRRTPTRGVSMDTEEEEEEDSLVIFDRSMTGPTHCKVARTSEKSSHWSSPGLVGGTSVPGVLPSHIYLFISMHLYSGTTLQHRLDARLIQAHDDHSPRPPSQVWLNMFAQIVDAVAYLHGNGLMHRDLKPSNILFDHQDHIRIADFGLATPLVKVPSTTSSSTTNPNTDLSGPSKDDVQEHTSNVGTELYMSPEQQQGSRYDQKVDIFALGIIFLEMMVPLATAMERVLVLSRARRLEFDHLLVSTYPEEVSFASDLLQEDPTKRPTCQEILAHHLLSSYSPLPGPPRSRSPSSVL